MVLPKHSVKNVWISILLIPECETLNEGPNPESIITFERRLSIATPHCVGSKQGWCSLEDVFLAAS